MTGSGRSSIEMIFSPAAAASAKVCKKGPKEPITNDASRTKNTTVYTVPAPSPLLNEPSAIC